MIANFLTILAAYLLAFVAAAPTAESESHLAKRSATDDITTGLQNVISSLSGLSDSANSQKWTASSIPSSFNDEVSNTVTVVQEFVTICSGADLSDFDLGSCFSLCTQLCSLLIDFIVNLVQWVLRVGIQDSVHCLQDCFNLCVSICDALTTIVGSNGQLTDPIANALSVIKGAGSFFGL